MEGECYLKTKSDRFKRHWAVIMGNEIYCYRNKNDPSHRIMHCLVGTFVKEMPEESSPTSKKNYFLSKSYFPQIKLGFFISQAHKINRNGEIKLKKL